MSYQLPLSERIRIKFEILCENFTDRFSSLSSSYKRPMFLLALCAVCITLKNARKNINKAKMSGAMGYGASSSGYGGYLYGGSSSSMTGGSGLNGGLPAHGGYGTSYGTGGRITGSSSPHGMRGASQSMGAPAYSNPAQSSMGGAAFGSPISGGRKGTADLVDANPASVVPLDPSIRFVNYGGSEAFYGQIEVIQAFDSPSFVSQIISQPGQSKVLVVDGGGTLNSALFDAGMANTAMRNGWKGVIVYGAVRSAGQLSKIGFGVKALGTNPFKGSGANGQRGTGINVGSSQVQNGLWIYADGDGIIMSQTDISGGSFGSGSSMISGGSSSMGMAGGTTGGFGTSSLAGGNIVYGGSSTSSHGIGNTGGMMGSSTNKASSLTVGYGPSNPMASSLTGGYNSNAMSGSTYGSGTAPMSGGYGGTSLNGGYGSSSPYSFGKSSMYSTEKRHQRIFKILLATSIAAIVWIVCLR